MNRKNRFSLIETIDFKSIINKVTKNEIEIENLKSEIEGIINSASFKIGRAITFIPRKIRDMFRKKK